MSVDALAVLNIEKLVAPRDEGSGIALPVIHQGDASIVSTWTRFDALTPDEFSLALRRLFGSALDAHDDPRGILFFPDVCEYRAPKYRSIVEELEPSGFWAPMVALDHVPVRYTHAAPGSHDALVGAMIERMGRDDALRLDLMLQSTAMAGLVSPDVARGFAEELAELERAMGADFGARYAASAREKARAEKAALEARHGSVQELFERSERGEPLVNADELRAFVASGAADAVFHNFDPTMRAALEEQLGALDTEGLPDDDFAKVIKTALERTKR